MGRVYAARDLETGREVAIKFLNTEHFTTANLRRFRREARIATAVRHRRVCEVFHLGVEQGVPYIVMERLVGETLRRRITETGPLSPLDAITLMIQVLDGLSAAHAVNVIHRDIKPGNIIITTPRAAPPQVKIIDFGLGKLMGPLVSALTHPSEELSAITETDMIPGTPSYMSPEQIAGVRDLDHRVDVWAAGLTLYELLLGRRPYVAPTYPEVVRRIMLVSLPPLSSSRADLPRGFDAVLEKALAKRRDERYQSAAEFRAALVEVWARHRTAAVARGERLRKWPEATTRADADALEEETELDILIKFEP